MFTVSELEAVGGSVKSALRIWECHLQVMQKTEASLLYVEIEDWSYFMSNMGLRIVYAITLRLNEHNLIKKINEGFDFPCWERGICHRLIQNCKYWFSLVPIHFISYLVFHSHHLQFEDKKTAWSSWLRSTRQILQIQTKNGLYILWDTNTKNQKVHHLQYTMLHSPNVFGFLTLVRVVSKVGPNN